MNASPLSPASLDLGEVQLDLANEQLVRGNEAIALRPKAFALLLYLAQNPNRLLSKQELLDEIWPEGFVGDAVLKVCVRELRQALQDDAKKPRFIETMHRRGYRFLKEAAPRESVARGAPPIAAAAARGSSSLVGRGEALARLQAAWERVRSGARQLVFVSGPPGIGKSTVVSAFLEQIDDGSRTARHAVGQCIEQFGGGEPFLPVLEAMGRLCRGAESGAIARVLRERAPTWWVQFPWLMQEGDRERLERELIGATRHRMLREICEALEGICGEQPVVLVLEDLHWSDYSTLDLLAALARRTEPARLLVIGTFRPVELILREHPLKELKQELVLHELCSEIALEPFSEDQVRSYLEERYGSSDALGAMAAWLLGATDGNPLFLLHMLEYLEAEGRLRASESGCALEAMPEAGGFEVPESLRQMIRTQAASCSEEQRVLLRAASLAGLEFTSGAVALGLGEEPTSVEERCQELTERGQFLRRIGTTEYPDGTLSPRYRFHHSLHRSVFRSELTPSRLQQIQRRLAQGGEGVYGERAAEIAVELAAHFEEGGMPERASHYRRLAAGNCTARFANREAIQHLRRGLELLDDGAENDSEGLRAPLLQDLGMACRAAGDMEGAARAFADFAEAAASTGASADELEGRLLEASALSWVDRDRCLAAVGKAEECAATLDDPLLRAHCGGFSAYWHLLWSGWRKKDLQASDRAVRAARKAGDDEKLRAHLSRSAFFHALSADYEEAVQRAREARELALREGESFDYVLSEFFHAWALLHSERWEELRPVLEEAKETARRNGHELWSALFLILEAWMHVETGDADGAIQRAERAVETARALGHGFSLHLGATLHGRALLAAGRIAEASEVLVEEAACSERFLMDSIRLLPLRDAQARCAMAQNDAEAARTHAEDLLRIAADFGERSYVARAEEYLAALDARS